MLKLKSSLFLALLAAFVLVGCNTTTETEPAADEVMMEEETVTEDEAMMEEDSSDDEAMMEEDKMMEEGN